MVSNMASLPSVRSPVVRHQSHPRREFAHNCYEAAWDAGHHGGANIPGRVGRVAHDAVSTRERLSIVNSQRQLGGVVHIVRDGRISER